jgi:HD-like signal output (HDOD) protein
VSSIEDAIARVGTGQVRALALAAFFNDAFPVAPGLDRETFWRDSQSYGGIAQWLASGIGSDSQQAWLTGFMVRVGELLMGLKVPGCVVEFERQPQYPGARWERETALMGFNEGQVSAELARAWTFPDAMVEALDAAANPLDVTLPANPAEGDQPIGLLVRDATNEVGILPNGSKLVGSTDRRTA